MTVDPVRSEPAPQSLRATWAAARAGAAVVWRASPRLIALAVALEVVAGVLIGAQLLLAQSVINQFADPGSDVAVTSSLVAILVVTAVTGLISAVLPDLVANIGERVSANASAEILRVASGVEAISFQEPGFHDLLQRASFAAQGRNRDIASSLLSLIGAMFAAGSVLAAVMIIEPLLAVPVVLGGLPMIWANRRNSRAFRTFVHAMTEHDRRRNYFWNVLTNPVAAKETRAHRLGGAIRDRHQVLQDERVAAYDRLVIDRIRRSVVGALFSSVVVVVTILFLVDRLNSDALRTGEVGAAILGVLLLTHRTRAMLSNAGRIYESALFISDYLDLLDSPVGPDVSQGRSGPVGELRATGVEFRYPEAKTLALKGVDIVARRGEVVALVGENGSGKSTLAHLLGGVYTPTGGEISVDGAPVDATTIALHRDRVAFVFQDFVRWALTGRENIALGRLDDIADDEAIFDAARRSGADQFLDGDDGYDTVLSRLFSGGTDLSLGQWQRLATARLIFRDAPIVVFDEPTASLDPVAERQIFELVREAMTDRVIILISHRLSSVRMADRIYVLEHGSVVEVGTHDELVDAGGAYERLYRAQAATFDREAGQ